MVNTKHAFWMALVFTIVIFFIGLLFGFFIESNRANSLQQDVTLSEINLLDEQVRNAEITNSQISCDLAKQSTFDFADKIYNEVKLLEKYDSTSNFVGTLKIVHARYDLLRMMVWAEANNIKSNCNSSFHTVIYFFNYGTNDLNVVAEQGAFSAYLTDMKTRYPEKILLVPIASNLNLGAINLSLSQYNVTRVPAVLIDNRAVISDVQSLTKIEGIVKE